MKRLSFVVICIALIFSAMFFVGCKKKNKSPYVPTIPAGPSSGAIDISYFFSSSATDPNGDSIAIRFDWGDGDTSNWSYWVASGDSVSMSHSWLDSGTYNIKAQAKDIKNITSDWSESNSIVIQDSTWTLVWTCTTPSAPWSRRIGLTSVIFDNKIWVLGGFDYDCYKYSNDVWFSMDGLNWINATDSTQWAPRSGHTSVVFNNKIWVMGGYGNSSHYNDVWFSADGINWICVTDSAGWSARCNLTSVIFDNKIWILAGRSDVYYYNDVWFSTDGIDWTCVNESTAWEPRDYPTSLVLDNKIWILGGCGEYLNWPDFGDVWKSTEGFSWDCVTNSAGWLAKRAHTSAIFDNKVWIMGGMSWDSTLMGYGPSNDIWYVDDTTLIQWNLLNEAPWQCLTNSAPWRDKEYHTSVVFDYKIWILGGVGGGNDVWYGEIVR